MDASVDDMDEPLTEDELDQMEQLYQQLTQQAAEEAAAREREEERRRPPPTPPDRRTAGEKAAAIKTSSGAVALYGTSATLYGPAYDLATFKAYLDDFMRSAGATDDPLERMFLEQLATCHHAIGRLHFRAGASANAAEVATYLAAAARLLGEFRRTTAALEDYRESLASKKVSASKAKVKSRRKTAATPINGQGDDGAGMTCDTELGGKLPRNRMQEFLREREAVLS